MRTPPELAILLAGLAEGFDRRSWHGTNLNGSIRGLGMEEATWRPRPTRHNIWELIVHTAYWKYAVTRRITGATRGGFPLKGSNWFRRPQLGTKLELAGDIALLRTCHRELVEAVRAIPADRLDKRQGRTRYTSAEVIRGIMAHDLYHAGQIQLLKRMYRDHQGV
jgi:uncharacterized damage-inducible protein DinB